jgi:hypothetical protein
MAQQPQDLPEQYDLIYEVISKRLEQQMDENKLLNDKVGTLLIVIGIAMAGLTQLIVSSLGYMGGNYKYLLVVEITMFAVSIYLVLKAFLLDPQENWDNPPHPSKLLETFSQHSFSTVAALKEEISKNIKVAYTRNRELKNRKYAYLVEARRFLYIGSALVFIHLCLLFFAGRELIIK